MKRSDKCRDIEKRLIEIVETKSALPFRKDSEDHLGDCSECRCLVEDFARQWQTLTSPTEIQTSPSFLSRILSQIQESETYDRSMKPTRAIWRPVFRVVTFTALIVLGVLTGAYLGHRPSSFRAYSEKPSGDAIRQYTEQYFGGFEEFPRGSLGEAYTTVILQEKEKKP
jgi:predicted anti-sigma-YlaC factor YlaD